MKKRRIYYNELSAHVVEFSCYSRRNLLNHDPAKKIVLGVLNCELENVRAKSSARWYEERRTVGVPIEWVK